MNIHITCNTTFSISKFIEIRNSFERKMLDEKGREENNNKNTIKAIKK